MDSLDNEMDNLARKMKSLGMQLGVEWESLNNANSDKKSYRTSNVKQTFRFNQEANRKQEELKGKDIIKMNQNIKNGISMNYKEKRNIIKVPNNKEEKPVKQKDTKELPIPSSALLRLLPYSEVNDKKSTRKQGSNGIFARNLGNKFVKLFQRQNKRNEKGLVVDDPINTTDVLNRSIESLEKLILHRRKVTNYTLEERAKQSTDIKLDAGVSDLRTENNLGAGASMKQHETDNTTKSNAVNQPINNKTVETCPGKRTTVEEISVLTANKSMQQKHIPAAMLVQAHIGNEVILKRQSVATAMQATPLKDAVSAKAKKKSRTIAAVTKAESLGDGSTIAPVKKLHTICGGTKTTIKKNISRTAKPPAMAISVSTTTAKPKATITATATAIVTGTAKPKVTAKSKATTSATAKLKVTAAGTVNFKATAKPSSRATIEKETEKIEGTALAKPKTETSEKSKAATPGESKAKTSTKPKAKASEKAKVTSKVAATIMVRSKAPTTPKSNAVATAKPKATPILKVTAISKRKAATMAKPTATATKTETTEPKVETPVPSLSPLAVTTTPTPNTKAKTRAPALHPKDCTNFMRTKMASQTNGATTETSAVKKRHTISYGEKKPHPTKTVKPTVSKKSENISNGLGTTVQKSVITAIMTPENRPIASNRSIVSPQKGVGTIAVRPVCHNKKGNTRQRARNEIKEGRDSLSHYKEVSDQNYHRTAPSVRSNRNIPDRTVENSPTFPTSISFPSQQNEHPGTRMHTKDKDKDNKEEKTQMGKAEKQAMFFAASYDDGIISDFDETIQPVTDRKVSSEYHLFLTESSYSVDISEEFKDYDEEERDYDYL